VLKNKIIEAKFNFCFAVLFWVTLGHFTFLTYEKTRIKDFWADAKPITRKSISRSPSSLLLLEGSLQTVNLLKSYFQFNTYNKFLNYELEIEYRSETADQSINDLAQQSLKAGLSRTINISGPNSIKSTMEKVLDERLLSELLANIQSSLALSKIQSGKFQINFNFKPQVIPFFNYENELSSHQLIQWDKVKAHDLVLEDAAASLTETAYSTDIPYNNEPFQYKGGQISLILDIQNNDQSFIIGSIRYRKFFKAPLLEEKIQLNGNNKMSVDHIYFLKNQNRAPYITVDIYQSFDSNQNIPKLEKVEFHLGKLSSDTDKKSILTGELILNGTYTKTGHRFEYETILKSLVFDLRQGDFTRHSKLSTSILSRTNSNAQKGQIQNDISKILLSELGLEFIQKLKLGTIQYFKGDL